MKPVLWLLAVALLANAATAVAQEQGKSAAGSVVVGVRRRLFTDEKRKNWQGTGPRPLASVVWYPAAAGGKLKAPDYGTPPELAKYFVSYPLADGAEVSPEHRRYPLIVMSHGTAGSALSLDWLGYRLASRGYIVAAVNHHGDTALESGGPLPQGFATLWERAEDLSTLISKMLADPVFGPHIDPGRIGAVGHSAGGATVIELAGGIYGPAHIQEWCKLNGGADANCHLPPTLQEKIDKLGELAKTDSVVQESLRRSQLPHRDSRVEAVFAMAPAIGIGFDEISLRAVHNPVAIVAGWGDDVTPLATNAERFASLIPTATLTVLPGKVGHATFGSECTPAAAGGPDWLGWICHDEDGVDRAEVHRQVEQLAVEFFRKAFTTH